MIVVIDGIVYTVIKVILIIVSAQYIFKEKQQIAVYSLMIFIRDWLFSVAKTSLISFQDIVPNVCQIQIFTLAQCSLCAIVLWNTQKMHNCWMMWSLVRGSVGAGVLLYARVSPWREFAESCSPPLNHAYKSATITHPNVFHPYEIWSDQRFPALRSKDE